jgi:hypothetical protein
VSFDLEKLYSLLPAICRVRDAQQGEPLKALFSVIVEQVEVVEEDLSQLYDDQFIETCAEWAIPYIGDLIGLRSAGGFKPGSGILRSEVAEAISLRRRKGTASALEELAHSSTDWPARVVEYFRLLATTQHMNHVRLGNISLASLRSWQALEDLTTPFDGMAHLADVRSISRRRGRHNIPNLGIFLWRLESFRIKEGTARKIDEGCFAFHPLGIDMTLFNSPQGEGEITHIAEHFNVPDKLGRRHLYEDLEALCQRRIEAIAGGAQEEEASSEAEKESIYFADNPVLKVYVDGNSKPMPSWKIFICDLSAWTRPVLSSGQASDPLDFPHMVAVDPVLGRLTFPIGEDPESVEVDYSYGFSSKMGGGGYERPELIKADIEVENDPDLLQGAIDRSGMAPQILEIKHSSTIETMESDLLIELNPGQELTIQGRNKERPVIDGSMVVIPAENAKLTLDGLLISGHISLTSGAAMTLKIRHCTLAPIALDDNRNPIPQELASIIWENPEMGSVLSLESTICGRLSLGEEMDAEIKSSIVDALDDSLYAIGSGEKDAGEVSISNSTIIGRVQVKEIDATNSIFTGIVNCRRRQNRCIRFCYLPWESQSPRMYSCQPDMAIRHAVEEAKKIHAVGELDLKEIAKEIELWLKPAFTDLDCTRPGYAQLRGSCPLEIRTGADDGSEMGAFHDQYQPWREANLCERLREHLRFGLEAGIFYVN